MCSHYEATTDRDSYRRHFGVDLPVGAELLDLWPGYRGSFIRRPRPEDHSGDPPDREAMAGVFGLIPHWTKDTTIARHTYNARSETVAEKPSYTRAGYVRAGALSAADQVVRDLKQKDGMQDYAKGSIKGLFDKLRGEDEVMLNAAIGHGDRTLHDAENEGNPNPSTEIQSLIRELRKLGSPERVG